MQQTMADSKKFTPNSASGQHAIIHGVRNAESTAKQQLNKDATKDTSKANAAGAHGKAGTVSSKGGKLDTGGGDPNIKIESFAANTKKLDFGTKSYAGLAEHKKQIMNSLDKMHPPASNREKALVLSAAMQETNNISGGDRTKDRGSAENMSPFNMNKGMLEEPGKPDEKGYVPRVKSYNPSIDLNQLQNLGKAAENYLDGIRGMGAEAWTAGHRGGFPAAQRVLETGSPYKPGDPKSHEYFDSFKRSTVNTMQAIMDNPNLMTNDKRVEVKGNINVNG